VRGALYREGYDPMPQAPSSSQFAPDIDVDDNKKYVAQLVGMDEAPSQFRDKRKDAMMDTYKFHLRDPESGTVVIDNNTGEPYELWKITNDLLYDNITSGKIAPGRELANALIGHRLSDDEITAMLEKGWEASLKGKYALADVEWKELPDGTQRLSLLRLRPYVRKQKKGEPPPPAPPDEDDGDGLPF
jgi:hypothetical protein